MIDDEKEGNTGYSIELLPGTFKGHWENTRWLVGWLAIIPGVCRGMGWHVYYTIDGAL